MLSFLSPVDHILSEFSTITCLSWVALHGMAHSFIELDKAVAHVISLISLIRQDEKEMTKDEMVGWHHQLDEHELEQAPGVGDGQ